MSAANYPKIIRANISGKYCPTPDTTANLVGRTVIITGANVGLGLETAKKVYTMHPARLILAVRNVSKGEDARKQIIASDETNGATAATTVDVWEVDLASFESVIAFGRRCEAELERLDILLENGGLMSGKWSTTKDGWETGLQVNVLSTFLMAALLAPLLAKTAALPVPSGGQVLKPHLVIVSSDLHMVVGLPEKQKPNILEALNTESEYVEADRYSTTKLLDLLLTQELANLPVLKDVVVCSVNPGFCRSELMRDMPSMQRRLAYAALARTTEDGAKTYLWSMLTDTIPSGSYTSDCQVRTPTGLPVAKDAPQVRERLWKEMVEILVKVSPATAPVWAHLNWSM